MPRKPISELTPEEAEKRREYDRKAKAKSRAKEGYVEKRKPDTRVRGSRAEEQRLRRARIKAKKDESK